MTDKPENRACIHCKTTQNTRPYGPGRAYTCKECTLSNPELAAIAEMYEKENIRLMIEEKAKELTEAFPGLRVIALNRRELAEALSDPDFRAALHSCDCPACTLARTNGECDCPACTIDRALATAKAAPPISREVN